MDKMIEQESKKLYYAYSAHTSIFCKWELRNIGYQTAWKWLAKHVLAERIKAQIDELQNDRVMYSKGLGDRLRELHKQLKEIEGIC